jgi:phosphoglycerol transferase MdoB-like AlkP superfamily enzyme
MNSEGAKSNKEVGVFCVRGCRFWDFIKHFFKESYHYLARRSYSVIIFGALFCTLGVKLFHSFRTELLTEYIGWIAADVAVLLSIELLLLLICYRWRKRFLVRLSIILAAVICTWSVLNAAWIIRHGTQILPSVLFPLFRDPFNSLRIVGGNLAKMPLAAVILLGPSAIALTFFFWVLAKPELTVYKARGFKYRVFVSFLVILSSIFIWDIMADSNSGSVTGQVISYNCHLRAVKNLLFSATNGSEKVDLSHLERTIPCQSNILLPFSGSDLNKGKNVVVVVLEGIQYRYTSLWSEEDLTPYLENLAGEGVTFSNMRCTVTHTTKALFSLFTGRYPSISNDIAEAVPVDEPYASLVTILKKQLGYRAAFFQSAKGDFECRPGLIWNLGFDTFWAREDLSDPNAFVGYLGCDEFSMMEPIVDWIQSGERPFLLAVLCSVTHDPYEVPKWYDKPKKDSLERYKQSVSYTDTFIARLDEELEKLGLKNDTIFCVIGDHGEAFGEHGLLGHERIGFEEVLLVPWVIRSPGMVEQHQEINESVSSIDMTPTLLRMLGFKIESGDFDGKDVLSNNLEDREVYFSGWLEESPIGCITSDLKYIYYSRNNVVNAYKLWNDPYEKIRVQLFETQMEEVSRKLLDWRRKSIFDIQHRIEGERTLYDNWICKWEKRIAKASYVKEDKRRK